MKSIAVKCPECDATLEATIETRQARCAYCGTVSTIQHRTGLLRRPEQIPLPSTEAPTRVATEARGHGVSVIVAIAVLVPLLLAVGLPMAWRGTKTTPPGGEAILADVNGDGRQDLVAVLRPIKEETVHVAAFDVDKGKRLWVSEELRRGSIGTLCVAGDVAIEGDKGATLHGVNLADGKLRWRARLDEAVKGLCVGETEASVRVLRADKRSQALSLTDGALQPATAATRCAPLRCHRPFERWANYLQDDEEKAFGDALPGMKPEKVIRAAGATVVLGYKTPGTSVPLIASVRPTAAPTDVPEPKPGDFTGGHGEGAKVLWRATVPAGDPLQARGGTLAAGNVAVGEEAVAVAYGLSDNSTHRLTAFSRPDGRRRFDIALPKAQRAVSTVLITPRRVIVTSYWRVTAAFDVKSGKQVWDLD